MRCRKMLTAVMAAAMASVLVFSGCKGAPEESGKGQSGADGTQSQTSAESKDGEKGRSDEESKESSKITPTVWEVKDKNGNIIYMMGSIHAADKDAKILPDYFETAYADSEALAVECDVTKSSVSIMDTAKFVYTDGTTVKDHVGEDVYKKAVKTLTDAGFYNAVYDRCKPVLWSAVGEYAAIGRAGLSSSYGVDVSLINRAHSEKKELIEIESVRSQLDLLIGLPEDIQNLLMLNLTQDNYVDDMAAVLTNMYDKWKKGTLTEKDVVTDDVDNEISLTDSQKKSLDEYSKLILTDRNKKMADAAVSYLNKGKKVMIVVGAAHFYGDDGIVALLKNEGCTIRTLSHSDASGTEDTSAENVSSEAESSAEALVSDDPGVPRAA